jgi:uncharacterized protein (DUF736 family)
MSTFEQKDNSGALFKNDRKEKDTHPDYRGTCMVNGVEMAMSAWLRTSKNGTKYMSFSFSEPYRKEQDQRSAQQAARDFGGFDDGGDEIPF